MSAPAIASGGRSRDALLALTAAYVDTVGFIGLFGLFTAHVTGNFVLIGAELVNRHGDVLMKLLVLPVFLASVALTAQAEVLLKRRGQPASAQLLGVEALLIAAAALACGVLGAPRRPEDLAGVVIGFLLVIAMGVQNTLMRTSLAGSVQTTVMTGNVTQITIDLLALATGRADETTRARVLRSWPAIVAFALGSALGAAGYAWIGFHSLWLAAVLVAAAVRIVLRS